LFLSNIRKIFPIVKETVKRLSNTLYP